MVCLASALSVVLAVALSSCAAPLILAPTPFATQINSPAAAASPNASSGDEAAQPAERPTDALAPFPQALGIQPSATPHVAAGAGLSLQNSRSLVDGENQLILLGEVYNNSSTALEALLTVIIAGGDGAILDLHPGTVLIEAIPAKQAAPYQVSLPLPAGYADHDVSVEGLPPARQLRSDLLVEVLRIDQREGFRLEGRLLNRGPALKEYAQVLITLFNERGEVAGYGTTFLEAAQLQNEADFSLVIDDLGDLITRYGVLVTGY